MMKYATPSHSEISIALHKQLAPTLELLRRMVEINSYTLNREGVERLAALTAQAFLELGFQAEQVPSFRPEYGRHLVLIRPGKAKAAVGLVSHLDTVFSPEEEIQNQFVWRQEGDRIYGPGTMDIKGGTALIHLMLSALCKCAPVFFDEVTWILFLNSSEEVLSPDFGRLCLDRLADHAKAALVFEAGLCKDGVLPVVVARKGRATFRVTVEGRSAHAGGKHEFGANAIVQLGEVVQRVAALTNFGQHLTFNVGTISGGTVMNRVPHAAEAEVEMRAFSKDVYEAGKASMLAMNGVGCVRSVADGYPCKVNVEVATESPPWPRNAGTDRLFETWRQAGEELGVKVLTEQRGGLSDGNYLWQAVPTLDGLGPSGDNDHCSERSRDGTKDQEYVEVSSFVTKAALNARAIWKLWEA